MWRGSAPGSRGGKCSSRFRNSRLAWGLRVGLGFFWGWVTLVALVGGLWVLHFLDGNLLNLN
jgi:hypothetical protein